MKTAKLVDYNGTGDPPVQNPALILTRDKVTDECDLVVLGVRDDGGNVSGGSVVHFENVPKGSPSQGNTWS